MSPRSRVNAARSERDAGRGQEGAARLYDGVLVKFGARRRRVAIIEGVVDTDGVVQTPARLVSGKDQIPDDRAVELVLRCIVAPLVTIPARTLDRESRGGDERVRKDRRSAAN